MNTNPSIILLHTLDMLHMIEKLHERADFFEQQAKIANGENTTQVNKDLCERYRNLSLKVTSAAWQDKITFTKYDFETLMFVVNNAHLVDHGSYEHVDSCLCTVLLTFLCKTVYPAHINKKA